MLYNGERIGNGNPPEVDVAVDPIDGTRLLSLGLPGAVSVVALCERGTMHCPWEVVYMNKIAVGPEAAGAIDIRASVADNLKNIARAKKKDVRDLLVVVLDRPRHADLVREIREAGARIKSITDGDVAGAISTAMEGTGADALIGIGGAPEAVLAAAALKCMGGEMQCLLWPRDDAEREACRAAGLALDRVWSTNDLVGGENVFFAITGITDGELLQGVHYFGGGATTQSIVMRSFSGTIRWVEARHNFRQLQKLVRGIGITV